MLRISKLSLKMLQTFSGFFIVPLRFIFCHSRVKPENDFLYRVWDCEPDPTGFGHDKTDNVTPERLKTPHLSPLSG